MGQAQIHLTTDLSSISHQKGQVKYCSYSYCSDQIKERLKILTDLEPL